MLPVNYLDVAAVEDNDAKVGQRRECRECRECGGGGHRRQAGTVHAKLGQCTPSWDRARQAGTESAAPSVSTLSSPPPLLQHRLVALAGSHQQL